MEQRKKSSGTVFIGDHSIFDGFAYCAIDGTKHTGRPKRLLEVADEDCLRHDSPHVQKKLAQLQYLQSQPDFCLLIRMHDDDGLTYRQLAEKLKSNPGTVFKQQKAYFRKLAKACLN